MNASALRELERKLNCVQQGDPEAERKPLSRTRSSSQRKKTRAHALEARELARGEVRELRDDAEEAVPDVHRAVLRPVRHLDGRAASRG